MTTTAPAPVAPATRVSSPYRLSFGRVLRSELIKLVTVRSTWWSLGVTLALSVGISLLIAAAMQGYQGEYQSIMSIVAPMQFTMLVAGILGAIVVTGEYSTGMIRSTLTAEPRRGVVVVAKALAVTLLLVATTVLGYAIAIIASTPFLAGRELDWSEPSTTIVPLLYGVLSMACFTLLGLGWGFIIRNGAGAIAATVGILFVLPIVLSLFMIAGEDWMWIADLGKYLPMSAAQTLTTAGAEDTTGALIATLAWPAAAVIGGWAVLRTRDA